MMRARRHIEVRLDAGLAQALHQRLRTEVLLRATTQEEVVHLLVELVRTREHTIVCRLHIQSED